MRSWKKVQKNVKENGKQTILIPILYNIGFCGVPLFIATLVIYKYKNR